MTTHNLSGQEGDVCICTKLTPTTHYPLKEGNECLFSVAGQEGGQADMPFSTTCTVQLQKSRYKQG